MKIADRNFVPIRSSVHAADQADVIDDSGRVWQQFGNLCSALAMLLEPEWTSQEFLAGLIDETELNFLRIIRAVELGQLRLRIGQIHVRRATVLEQ